MPGQMMANFVEKFEVRSPPAKLEPPLIPEQTRARKKIAAFAAQKPIAKASVTHWLTLIFAENRTASANSGHIDLRCVVVSR